MRSTGRVIASAIAGVVASAAAAVVTLFLVFWLLSVLLDGVFPSDPHREPWWVRIPILVAIACAVAVARYVWRQISGIYRDQTGSPPGQGRPYTGWEMSSGSPTGGRDVVVRGPPTRLGTALRWTLLTTLLAFAAMFFTPLILGGPGGSLAPIFAIVLAPVIFLVTLALTLIHPRLGIITIAASLLYPVWYYAKSPPRRPEGSLLPLNAEERAAIRSRHFGARVAVDPGRFPPAYQKSLVEDLGRTGLFTEVGSIGGTRSPDLIATVTGGYYGDTTGQHFSLHWANRTDQEVEVKVWHYVPGCLYWNARRLEVERLTLEVIRQMDALGPRPSIDLEKPSAGTPSGAHEGATASPSWSTDLLVTRWESAWFRSDRTFFVDVTIANRSETQTYKDLEYEVVLAESGCLVEKGRGVIYELIMPGETRRFRRVDTGLGVPSRLKKPGFGFRIVDAIEGPQVPAASSFVPTPPSRSRENIRHTDGRQLQRY